MQITNPAQQRVLNNTKALEAPRPETPSAASRLNTAKALFVFAAGLSFLFSVYLWFLVDREQGLFVGIWVPSILALGALLLGGREEQR